MPLCPGPAVTSLGGHSIQPFMIILQCFIQAAVDDADLMVSLQASVSAAEDMYLSYPSIRHTPHPSASLLPPARQDSNKDWMVISDRSS